MFSTTQIDFLGQLVCQYDYYVAYYYASFYDYTTGETRDNLIQVYCSDQLPTYENGTFNFTECNYYEITNNKYMLLTENQTLDFTPISSSDILYTNVLEGYPQLSYSVSSVRNFDFGKAFVLLLCVVVSLVVVSKVLFGGIAK